MLFHYRGAIVATDQTATFIGDIVLPRHAHATLYYRATSSGGSDAAWAEAFPNERLDGFHTVCAYEVFRKVPCDLYRTVTPNEVNPMIRSDKGTQVPCFCGAEAEGSWDTTAFVLENRVHRIPNERKTKYSIETPRGMSLFASHPTVQEPYNAPLHEDKRDTWCPAESLPPGPDYDPAEHLHSSLFYNSSTGLSTRNVVKEDGPMKRTGFFCFRLAKGADLRPMNCALLYDNNDTTTPDHYTLVRWDPQALPEFTYRDYTDSVQHAVDTADDADEHSHADRTSSRICRDLTAKACHPSVRILGDVIKGTAATLRDAYVAYNRPAVPALTASQNASAATSTAASQQLPPPANTIIRGVVYPGEMSRDVLVGIACLFQLHCFHMRGASEPNDTALSDHDEQGLCVLAAMKRVYHSTNDMALTGLLNVYVAYGCDYRRMSWNTRVALASAIRNTTLYSNGDIPDAVLHWLYS